MNIDLHDIICDSIHDDWIEVYVSFSVCRREVFEYDWFSVLPIVFLCLFERIIRCRLYTFQASPLEETDKSNQNDCNQY